MFKYGIEMTPKEMTVVMEETSFLNQLDSPGVLKYHDAMIIQWTKKIRKFAVVTEKMDGSLEDLLKELGPKLS